MLFNSYEFIFAVLPLSVLGYFLLARLARDYAVWWLGAVSLFFYAWWRAANLPIFLGSILTNFAIARGLQSRPDGRARHALLLFGVLFNLTLLGIFKYSRFAVENVNAVFSTSFPLPEWVLPLGISFFTFTQITYLVDMHREHRGGHSLPVYLLFVSFFPHLLAGPILHHAEMLPQFVDRKNSSPSWNHCWRGLALFGVGLAKKVLIADSLTPFVTAGFDGAGALGFAEAWLAALAYYFRIYFDFSGYTDMAIGTALLFNIRLPFNFDSPYQALTIQDFWRRWHITLGRFFRDYVYIPLGGNRHGARRNMCLLFSVALVSGVWHGASWGFVVWGAAHGVAMVIHFLWKRAGHSLPRPVAWLLMFLFLNVSWVLFRSPSLSRARELLWAMLGGGSGFHRLAMADLKWLLAYLAIAFAVVFYPTNSNALARDEYRPSILIVGTIALLMARSILQLNRISEFIYFNF